TASRSSTKATPGAIGGGTSMISSGFSGPSGGAMEHDYVDYWAVHSSRESRPVFRAWAKSEAEAEKRLAELKKGDRDSEKTEYWVVRMTRRQVDGFKKVGFMPADA